MGKATSKVSRSLGETRRLAQEILRKHRKRLEERCLIFALKGELGTGKTQLAKGLGRVLGIRKIIVSPSFALIREYPFRWGKIRGVFYHLDAWRIESAEEITALNLEKVIKPGNVLVIEWAEKMEGLLERWHKQLPTKIIKVKLEHIDGGKRRITIMTND